MNILFIGFGSIAKKHINIIAKNYPSFKIYILSSGKKYFFDDEIFDIPQQIRKRFLYWNSIDKENIKFDIAFVCSPTYLHIQNAIECAQRKIDLFIEKPLSSSIDDIYKLVNIVSKNKLTAYIAYPFRFHSKIKTFKEDNFRNNYLSKYNGTLFCYTNIDLWGKESYSFDYKKGGGVLFELSHEIDLIQYIFDDIITIDGILKKHKVHNINSSAYLNLKLKNGNSLKLVLRLDSNIGYTERYFLFCKNNKIKKYISYRADEKMYEDQIKYFFSNYKNKLLTNNIYDAVLLFEKIYRLEEKSWIN